MIRANIRDRPHVFLARSKNSTTTLVYTPRLILTRQPSPTNRSYLGLVGHCKSFTTRLGGRVPRYQQPPYGDADNRVRATASEVFGLASVIWSSDAADWSSATNGTTLERIQDQFKESLAGPRSPCLIILEHRIEGYGVTAFINSSTTNGLLSPLPSISKPNPVEVGTSMRRKTLARLR